ncbi:MAG: LysE family translocator [Desulfobacterales bacterium]|nr:LysE family translocator [Desulfobacterales bacterium]
MSFEFWFFFCVTVFVASIIPGPSMLLALTHGIKYGFKRTFATAFGNVAATFIQALISISGLSAILIASSTIFTIIKWIGALYLIYLGINIFLSKKTIDVVNNDREIPKISLRKMFIQAFFVAFGNPKAIVFFTALFPQFINLEESTLPQFTVLMISMCVIAFFCMLIYSYCGKKVTDLFSKRSFSGFLNKITGLSFVAAGLGILLQNNE